MSSRGNSKKNSPTLTEDELSYSYVRSPNRKFSLRIGSRYESSYGILVAETLHLLDRGKQVIFDFRPLACSAKNCKWSKDSRYIIAAGSCLGFIGICVVDLRKEKFGLVNLKDSPQIEPQFMSLTKFRVKADSSQLKAHNNVATFGAGKAEFPCKRYRGETPVVLDVNDLSYYPLKKLPAVASLSRKAQTITVRIVEDGFHPFKGSFPQSTTQKFNTRQMEVFHLELFAGYGDPVAAEWLKEIRRLSKNRYSPWERVSNYLGKRKRPRIQKHKEQKG